MNIKVVWDNSEHTILRYVFPENWSREEYEAADEEASKMLSNIRKPVGALVELPSHFVIPPQTVQPGKYFITVRHPRIYMTVIVGLDPVALTLFNTFKLMHPELSEFIDTAMTLSEGRRLLTENYPTVSAR
jgi:hypothetical protein